MLELADNIFRSFPLSRKLDNLSLNCLIFQAFRHKFTHEELLFFNKVFEFLLLLFVLFVLFLDQLVSAFNLVSKLLVQVYDALVQVLLVLELFLVFVDFLHRFLAFICRAPDGLR